MNNIESLTSNNFHNEIPRCPNCNLICSINLIKKTNQSYIRFLCENNHQGEILLADYLNIYNKFSLSKEKCSDCNKSQNEVKGEFFYCTKCHKFICNLCQSNHKISDNHFCFNLERYDGLCKIHSNLYSFYCINCNKNICIYCSPNHEKHNIINLANYNYTKENFESLKDEINNIELFFEKIDKIKQEIIILINGIKESNKNEIKLIKQFLKTYEYEKNYNNLNYNVINNLKNYEIKFKPLINKIYEKGIKFKTFLTNLYQPNYLKNMIKTLNNHTKAINYLDKLFDGRLVSCSNDTTLKIFNKNTNELELSIKEHLFPVRSFTQLKNGKIITCSDDKTMKIIKLIDKDKYEVEETLRGHTEAVYKVIEIRQNELISISLDKSMKVWKYIEKSFNCITTIIFQNIKSYCDIIKLNDKEFVTSSKIDECIKFWKSNDYFNIATINNISMNNSGKILCLLNKNILCVGGINSKGFYLINISTHQVISNILKPRVVWSINKCSNNLILCSIVDEIGYHCIVIYNFEENYLYKIMEKKSAHFNNILSCVDLPNGIIASGGDDRLIKLWSE